MMKWLKRKQKSCRGNIWFKGFWDNCPPIPKLTLSQTLTLTGGQYSSGAISWLPSNPKIKPDLVPAPNPNRGVLFLGGEIVRIPV